MEAVSEGIGHVVESKDLIKVIDDRKGFGLKVLNGAETKEAQLNADKNNHDGDNSLKQKDSSHD